MRYREILEACWTGYRQQGMKRKGSRMVPNCVPVSEQQPAQPQQVSPQVNLPVDMTGAADPTVAAYFQTKAELEAFQKAIETGEGGRATYVANPEERARFIARLQANIQRLEGELQQKGLLSAVQQAEAQLQQAQQHWIKKSSANRHYPEMTTAQLEENLRDWFKQKWVRFGPDGKIRGSCARGGKSEGKPKCLPAAKAHALGKKGRASAAAKKRREDPNPERRGAAKNVATRVTETNMAATKPEDPSWNEIGRRYDSHITSDAEVNQVSGTGHEGKRRYSDRIAQVKGPNTKGEYLVTVMQNGHIVADYVTKTPPKSWMYGQHRANPWTGKDAEKAAAWSKLGSEVQKWLGNADPTDPAVLARAPKNRSTARDVA